MDTQTVLSSIFNDPQTRQLDLEKKILEEISRNGDISLLRDGNVVLELTSINFNESTTRHNVTTLGSEYTVVIPGRSLISGSFEASMDDVSIFDLLDSAVVYEIKFYVGRVENKLLYNHIHGINLTNTTVTKSKDSNYIFNFVATYTEQVEQIIE